MYEVVSGQSVWFGEALPTEVTRVWPGACVGDDMLLLSSFALEPLLTQTARVGSVIYVGPVVLGKLPLGEESLSTLTTQERSLSRVHPLMSGQDGYQGEPLGTVGALKRPLTSVDLEVLFEHKTKGEPFSTLAALVRPLSGVAGQVTIHVGPTGVRFITESALKLPLGQVDLPVLGPRQQSVEALAALVAGVVYAGPVGLLVLLEFAGGRETLATYGTQLRKLALPRVGLSVVDGEGAEVGEGGPTLQAREGGWCSMVLALVFGQVPGVLERAVTAGTMERSFPCVDELVSPHVRRAGEGLTARFAREGLLLVFCRGESDSVDCVGRIFSLVNFKRAR